MTKRIFRLYLIKPSHYDDDGYVIQWWRSPIPSNSLAAVYGLVRDCIDRQVLGPDVQFDVQVIDETNTEVHVGRIAAQLEAADVGMVMLVGVQSNQFPRALDIARPLRARGIQVGIGGFHVSGVISMLNGEDDGFKEAQALGISLFAGEAEGRLEAVLRDANTGTLQPLYNFMNDLPGIEDTPVPFLPANHVGKTAYNLTSFDAGRGCPYQCSFCTIINVQGRKSRRRSPDDVEKIVRANLAQGVHRFFITDDNFARNKDWEAILDRLIALREGEKLDFNFIIQVDTLCHKIENFVEKCARAGVKRVFIGLENVNPANLMGAKKRQNKITEYRTMLLAWKAQHVITYAGYILGFPGDTPERIAHDIAVIQRELPVDLLEFFFLTPLPGSEDHQTLHRSGVAMDADLNRYDLNHVTTAHPLMSRAQWEKVYADAWLQYYTPAHVETIMRRAAVTGISTANILLLVTWFVGSVTIEGVHPLEGGGVRRKYRHARRPELGLESPLVFYPRYWAETAGKLARWAALYLKFGMVLRRVDRDPAKADYTDVALTPVSAQEEALEMFQSSDAQAWLTQEKRIDRVRHGQTEAAPPA
ncbi:MAG: radical SAM protein [Alphaproteobacteria bacterium]|nr:radical SAM protein [Alphaproteobacteria bacterium]